jgi:molecular chaperone DnaK
LQSEATLAAAHEAGLDRVALLQEPVAAALGSMVGARSRSGVFLIYDLGGGTFDAALVDAREGEVTVLAHEGVNMLGGRDLDRLITDEVALPWLRGQFELPDNLTADRRYERLRRVTRRAVEAAKIVLSTQTEASISASDEEMRLEDLRGEPIYLNIPFKRSQLESMAGETVTKTISCCRDMLAHAGFRHEDVARIVLIGGPTKMPMLQRRVEDELGIQVDKGNRIDPMTAVAAGAAIYCEGRDWSAHGSTAKTRRRRESGGTRVKVSCDFEARTTADHARLTVTQESGQAGAEVLVESRLGWSSGRQRLSQPVVLDLKLTDRGSNRFTVTVFANDGSNVVDAGREIVIERLLAATGGVPATHTIAVKILGDDGNDTLDVIVHKGTLLPATGVVGYRSTRLMRAGEAARMRIQLFEIDNEMVTKDPDLNQCIGVFEIRANDLPDNSALRKGDDVKVHWAMTEGQTITAEVELPQLGQYFDRRNFYNWQLARVNFAGEEGQKLAAEHLERAERNLSDAEDAVPVAYSEPLPRLRQRLDAATAAVRGSADPDSRRQAVEEIRQVRQAIAGVCQQPDARRELLRRRLVAARGFYDRDVRAGATRDQAAQADVLIHSADVLIEKGSVNDLGRVAEQIAEANRLYWRHGLDQHAFCLRHFRIASGKRHLAEDPVAFDRTVSAGEKAINGSDTGAVREALFSLWRGEVSLGDDIHDWERASLMRA